MCTSAAQIGAQNKNLMGVYNSSGLHVGQDTRVYRKSMCDTPIQLVVKSSKASLWLA